MTDKHLIYTTERLEIKPLVNSDYDSWLKG